jgi:hypothetical protein
VRREGGGVCSAVGGRGGGDGEDDALLTLLRHAA